MSRDWFDDVLEFQKTFGFRVRTRPDWPTEPELDLRLQLIREEYQELLLACEQRNLPDTADAIVDLIYVLLGMATVMGIDARPVWNEVHRANMSKVGGPKSPNGKLLKPEGWQPPDIQKALSQGQLEPLGMCPIVVWK